MTRGQVCKYCLNEYALNHFRFPFVCVISVITRPGSETSSARRDSEIRTMDVQTVDAGGARFQITTLVVEARLLHATNQVH